MRKNLHSNAFNLIWFRGIAGEDRARRIATDDFHIRILLLEISCGAGDGTTSTNTRYKCSDLPGGIAPDFWAGCSIMSSRVGGIGVLIGATGTWNLVCQSVSHIFIMFW